MKKIGILAFSDMTGGGVYQYTQSIIDALSEDKTSEYIILCSSNDERFDKYNLEVRKFNKPQSSFFKKLIRAFQFIFFIRKPIFFSSSEHAVFKDIDLFISPAVSAYPHFYLNKPFIFTLHDMQERYFPLFFSKYERIIRYLNNKTLVKSAKKIICESSFVKNDITKFFKVNKNIIHIIQAPPPKNFLEFKFKYSQSKIIKKKYALPARYIFYPANSWRHKNHTKLLDAFKIVNKEFNGLHLVLSGTQCENFKSLIKKIKILNLESNVTHIGYVEYEDLPYIFKMAEMLVMPTLFESVSIPIYEAFSLKVPVCCSNVVALPDQVGDAGLIFDPLDEKDIAKKIIMYLKSKKLRINNANKGYHRIANFNHKKYSAHLLKLIKT